MVHPRLGLVSSEIVDLYEERAAIREYDGGLPRGEAEIAAADDVLAFGVGRVPTVILTGILGEWQRALDRLDPERQPCPVFKNWPAVLRAAKQFLVDHGKAAERFQWSELELFGTHRRVGSVRSDCSGALVVSGGSQVVEVTADLIRFSNGLTYRRAPWPPGDLVAPLWRFGQ